MPLLDHFHPPIKTYWQWRSIHSAWPNSIVQKLNKTLPPGFYAVPNIQVGGPVEIDVAMLEGRKLIEEEGAVATRVWAPPRPLLATPVDFAQLDLFEVQVFYDEEGPRLVSAIELVSPANKDRPSSRLAFARKCAALLQDSVSVMIIDIVTERPGNLHQDLINMLRLEKDASWMSPSGLYASAYRIVGPRETARLEIWPEPLALGTPLPRLPLWLGTDVSIELDLEETYLRACESLRITQE